MKDTLGQTSPFARKVAGEPVEAHGYVVTPIARVRGRIGVIDDERGSGRWGWLAVRPSELNVLDREGNTRELRIASMESQAITAMAAIALLATFVGMLVGMIAREAQR